MSKNKNDMKKKITLLGTAMAASVVPAEVAAKRIKNTYDISIPMARQYSICIPKTIETKLTQHFVKLVFRYLTLKKLITMRTSIPVSILKDYTKRLEGLEMLYLSGNSACTMRSSCASYLEHSLLLNMDKNMNLSIKHKERMRISSKLRRELSSSFSETGIKDLCMHLKSIIKEMESLKIEQDKDIEEYYVSKNKENKS